MRWPDPEPVVQSVEIYATVTRADGTVEDLGLIATAEVEESDGDDTVS